MKRILEQWQKFIEFPHNVPTLLFEEEPLQRAVRQKHKRNRLTIKGVEKEEAPFDVDPPEERSKSAPPMEEEEDNVVD